MATGLSTMLIQLRAQAGYTSCRNFALQVGLSRESLRRYESGKALPSNQSLMKILGVLGLCPEKDEQAKKLVMALCEERRKKNPSAVRAFGTAATEELKQYYNEIPIQEQQRELLLNLFFDHLGEQDESKRHYLSRKIEEILRS